MGAVDGPGALADFRTDHPLVEVHIRHAPGGWSEMAAQVREGQLDLAFILLPARELPGVELTELSRERITVIAAAPHPLAKRRIGRPPGRPIGPLSRISRTREDSDWRGVKAPRETQSRSRLGLALLQGVSVTAFAEIQAQRRCAGSVATRLSSVHSRMRKCPSVVLGCR
jgi:LysR substrate binding domain